jgi:NADH:ubiquinone oxidoreductase subunit F (NADH-binding)
MNSLAIITQLKESNLLGKGGANFPTGLKWEMVKATKAERKYIICNVSECEPGVFKDRFILENYPEEVIEGIKIALKTIKGSSAYIYLRKDYYEKFKERLEKLISGCDITLFKKTGGYVAGEETSVLESIEGKRSEPRIKPPFPPQSGLWGCPTLINNVETFYHVAKIVKGNYKKTRFYSVSGEIENQGVYELSENYSITRILKETKNWPNFDFFIQSGGGAIGEILLPNELNQSVGGAGAIIVFNRKKTNLFSLMKKWIDFFLEGNCDKCTPCREGVYRIAEMIEKEKIDKKILKDLLFVLEESSFCALGKGVVVPFRSLINKLFHD